MQKALITYLSKTGTTKYFGHNIEKHLKSKGIECEAKSIHDVSPSQVSQFDILFFGCWTHGLFVAFQHPNKEWVKWAKSLPKLNSKKIVLFTTYKLATGSMFRTMKKHITVQNNMNIVDIKSKSEDLSEEHKNILNELLETR